MAAPPALRRRASLCGRSRQQQPPPRRPPAAHSCVLRRTARAHLAASCPGVSSQPEQVALQRRAALLYKCLRHATPPDRILVRPRWQEAAGVQLGQQARQTHKVLGKGGKATGGRRGGRLCGRAASPPGPEALGYCQHCRALAASRSAATAGPRQEGELPAQPAVAGRVALPGSTCCNRATSPLPAEWKTRCPLLRRFERPHLPTREQHLPGSCSPRTFAAH